jgi:hypothetical protein
MTLMGKSFVLHGLKAAGRDGQERVVSTISPPGFDGTSRPPAGPRTLGFPGRETPASGVGSEPTRGPPLALMPFSPSPARLALNWCRPLPGASAGNGEGTSCCSHSAPVVRILADALERFRRYGRSSPEAPEVLHTLWVFEAHACGVVVGDLHAPKASERFIGAQSCSNSMGSAVTDDIRYIDDPQAGRGRRTSQGPGTPC